MRARALARWERAAALVGLICALGCGTEDPGANDQPGAGGAGGAPSDGGAGPELPTGRLLPFATGNAWEYRVTQDGAVTEKRTTVGDFGLVGGEGPFAELEAFHVVTKKGANLADRTESWQAPDPDAPERVVRFRELSFGAQSGDLQLEEHWDPAKLHVDGSAERIFSGSTWNESYEETKLEVGRTALRHTVTETWTVISDDEAVSVPAGDFEHAVHLRKTTNGKSKDYWYLRGVGKLKEVGTQTEELTDYTIAEDPP